MEMKKNVNFEVANPTRKGNNIGRKKKKKKKRRKKHAPYSAETQFCPAARKIDLMRHVSRGLSELAESYNIQRKKRIYGDSIIRISISTRHQLLHSLELLHYILDTQKIQINEIAFPSVDKINSSRGFVLHVATSNNASVLEMLKASDLHFNVSETSTHFDETSSHTEDHSKLPSSSCVKRKSGGKHKPICDDQNAKEPEKPSKKPEIQPFLPQKPGSKNVPARRISKQAQSDDHYQCIELRNVPAKQLPMPAPQPLHPKACNIIHEIYPDYESSRVFPELNPMAEEFIPNIPEVLEYEPPMVEFIPHPDMVGTTFDENDIRLLQYLPQRHVTFSPAPVLVASPINYDDVPAESEIRTGHETKRSKHRKKRKKKRTRKKQLFPIIKLTEGQWYTVILVTFIAVVIPYSLLLRYL